LPLCFAPLPPLAFEGEGREDRGDGVRMKRKNPASTTFEYSQLLENIESLRIPKRLDATTFKYINPFIEKCRN